MQLLFLNKGVDHRGDGALLDHLVLVGRVDREVAQRHCRLPPERDFFIDNLLV